MTKLTIRILPTDKASRIILKGLHNKLVLYGDNTNGGTFDKPQLLYLTQEDAEIKEGDWVLCSQSIAPTKALKGENYNGNREWKKIIATNDDLYEDLGHVCLDKLPTIHESDLPYLVELRNKEIREVECETEIVLKDRKSMGGQQINSVGRFEIPKFNSDGSIALKRGRIKISMEEGTPIPAKDIEESGSRIAKSMKQFKG